eukprot:scaffold5669_cov144-Skeletonema_menzelii.AAC.16
MTSWWECWLLGHARAPHACGHHNVCHHIDPVMVALIWMMMYVSWIGWPAVVEVDGSRKKLPH